MGSSQNKDQHVQIYLTLNKPMTYAGQTVQGAVHINCSKERPYRYLTIIIQGSEQVLWAQNYNNIMTTFTNYKDTYLAQITLAKFDLGIKPGHYSFPFSVFLPKAFPASLHLDGSNYIKYEILAHIPPYDQKSQAQIFRRTLNLREPCRSVLPPLSGQQICESECCGCFCSNRSVALQMSADVSFIEYGKIFHLKGLIDNSSGQLAISNYKIVFREVVKKVSGLEFTNQDYNDILLYDAMKPVPKGFQQNFSCEVRIPPEITGYTAIGSIIYRTYFIALIAQTGCCTSDPTLHIHSVFTNPVLPEVNQKQQKQPPVGWNPVTAAPLVFVNVKPYIYLPSKMIDVRNQEGQVMHNQMNFELQSAQRISP